jgi:SAM-dependent methyltransferase
METQAQAAARIYDERAPTYEDSWHPDYSRRVMALAAPRPGDRVLVLCCGTGLEVFLAADAGASLVVGVDASPGMLQVATETRRRRLAQGSEEGVGEQRHGKEEPTRKQDACASLDNHSGGDGGGGGDEEEEPAGTIRLLRHDVKALDACGALAALRASVDLVVCLNAFVLFAADPAAVVRGWRPWLAAGGRSK